MHAKYLKEGKEQGAKWVIKAKFMDEDKPFYTFAFSLREKREIEEEYRWSEGFEILEIAIISP